LLFFVIHPETSYRYEMGSSHMTWGGGYCWA